MQTKKEWLAEFSALGGYELFHDIFRREHINKITTYKTLKETMSNLGATVKIITTVCDPRDILYNCVELPENTDLASAVAVLTRGEKSDVVRGNNVRATTAIIYIKE